MTSIISLEALSTLSTTQYRQVSNMFNVVKRVYNMVGKVNMSIRAYSFIHYQVPSTSSDYEDTNDNDNSCGWAAAEI